MLISIVLRRFRFCGYICFEITQMRVLRQVILKNFDCLTQFFCATDEKLKLFKIKMMQKCVLGHFERV